MTLPLSQIFVETERLVLRVPETRDFTPYAEMSADAETFRYSDRGPMSSDEAWSRLLRHAGHWSLLGHGVFMIEDKESGRFAGECGFGDFKREMGPDFDGTPEGAWSIAPWARGRGYATEAAAGALRWIEEVVGAERTVCLVHSENLVSIRVAEKLGYRAFREGVYRGNRSLLFERFRIGAPQP